jgi:hypothetical protein
VQHNRAFIALQHAMKKQAPNLWQYPKINIDALKHVEKNVLIACQCK